MAYLVTVQGKNKESSSILSVRKVKRENVLQILLGCFKSVFVAIKSSKFHILMALAAEGNPYHNKDKLFGDPVTQISVDFLGKLKYESKTASSSRRSKLFEVLEKTPQYDIWTLQPPNFNPQAFEADPNKKRNERLEELKANFEIASELSKSAPNASERRKNDKRIQDLFNDLRNLAAADQRAKTSSNFRTSLPKPRFRLRFQPEDKWQSQIEFSKYGKHQRESYTAPQPHDYRQVFEKFKAQLEYD